MAAEPLEEVKAPRSHLALGCETCFSILQPHGRVSQGSHLAQSGVGQKLVGSRSEVGIYLQRWRLGGGAYCARKVMLRDEEGNGLARYLQLVTIRTRGETGPRYSHDHTWGL